MGLRHPTAAPARARTPARRCLGPYGQPQRNGSALALTITAGILTVFCCSLLTLPSLILGIIGLTKQSTDPEGSARPTRYG